MTVYFLRHASAGERHNNPAKDEKRALDRTGIEQGARVGRILAALEVQVDSILTSPLKRASQTAALVGNEIGHEGPLEIEAALRPEAPYTAFQQLIERQAHRDAILVVGHNPNLSLFLGRMVAGGGRAARIELRKAALARVEVGRAGGALEWLLTPKLARACLRSDPQALAGGYAEATTKSRPKTSRK